MDKEGTADIYRPLRNTSFVAPPSLPGNKIDVGAFTVSGASTATVKAKLKLNATTGR